MRRPGLLCLVLETTHHFPAVVQLQHELRHELLAHISELLFRSLPVRRSKRFCLTPASEHVALPICTMSCRIRPCWELPKEPNLA